MRITFASVPAYGHVLPMAPLAAAAAAAGHEVEFRAGAAFADCLPVAVFDGVPAGLTLQSTEAEAEAEVTWRCTTAAPAPCWAASRRGCPR